MTSEERELLKRMDAGELDGMVGDMFQTDGGSTVWTIIKNGIPVSFLTEKKMNDTREFFIHLQNG